MKREKIVTQVKKDEVTQSIIPEPPPRFGTRRAESGVIGNEQDLIREERNFKIKSVLERQKRIQKVSEKVDSSVEKKISSEVLDVKSKKNGFDALSQKEIKNNIQKHL